MRRPRVWLAVLALFLVGIPPAGAHYHEDLDQTGGGTQVSVSGRTVRITVTVDVIMPASYREIDPPIPDSWFDMIREGLEGAASFWNQALRDLDGDCIDLEIATAVNFVDGNDEAYGGGHNLFIHNWYLPVFMSPQLTTETTNDDTAEVFTTNGTAFLATWMFLGPDYRDLSHELGHMFGLGDDFTRDEAGNPVFFPGREETLMGGGDLVDQALLSRIVSLLKRAGEPVPECWEGTIELVEDTNHEFCTPGTFSAELEFAVTAEGEVSGTATFEHGAITCEGGTTLAAHSGTAGVGGEKAGGTLVVFLTNVQPFVGARMFVGEGRVEVGDRTSGEADVDVTGIGRYHVTLTCTSCEGSDPGVG